MGICSSCCGRRHKEPKHDSERQPLLRSESFALKDASSPYEKIADILGALQAGKLPTQLQLDNALRTLLISGILDVEAGKKGGALDEAGVKVVRDTKELVEAFLRFGMEKNGDDRLQDLVYQVRRLSTVPMDVTRSPEIRVNDGVKKNVDVAASAIPSQEEVASDTAALLTSVKTLSKVILTSSAFRAILADLLITARETVANSVEQIRKAAQTVEQVSESVEKTLMPEIASSFAKREGGEEPIIEERSPKEAVLDRLEETFLQAQASPPYNSALRVILYILRKYSARVSVIAESLSEASEATFTTPTIEVIAPVILPDPRFQKLLEDAQAIVERLAGGKSLDVPLQSLFQAVKRIYFVPNGQEVSDVQLYCQKVGKWLDDALADLSYVSSRRGRVKASNLYDEGQHIFMLDETLSKLLNDFLTDVQDIVEAIKADVTTRALLNTFDNLQHDIKEFGGSATQKGRDIAVHWRARVVRALLGWLLPRALRAIRVLPMPRVEFVSQESNGSRLAVAIDALLMTASESLLPDVLGVQEFAEVRAEIDERAGSAELTTPNARLLGARRDIEQGDANERDSLLGRVQNGYGSLAGPSYLRSMKTEATSRVRLHIEGLRISAHDVGYYASYALNSWVGYEDEGLLSIDIGRGLRRGEGLALDIELEVGADSGDVSQQSHELFRVLDVQSSLHGLSLRLSRSKHWILNNVLVSPFAGPIGRAVAPMIINSQIRNGLHSLEKILRDVKGRAEERAVCRTDGDPDSSPDSSDWWGAVFEIFSRPEDDENSESDMSDDDEVPTHTESEIGTTLTGIYRTTVTKPDTGPPATLCASGSEAPTAESTLAIGLGAQLLPGKAEQAVMDVSRETPAEAAQDVAESAREAIDDIQESVTTAASNVQGAAVTAVEDAVESRRVAERGVERMKKQEVRERGRKGWESHAFDILESSDTRLL